MSVDHLRQLLKDGAVLTDPDVMRAFEHDEAALAHYGTPMAVVRPRSTREVQAVVRYAVEHRVPVVPRGAGTGLSGGANALDGCIVLAMDRMDRILEISKMERLAVVQPGVINDDLRRACAVEDLWYPPDPGSAPWSTIGGNVATNAGGICCVKYGVTRDYVLALQVVTGLGDIVSLGRRTAKGVAGYDLCGLMVGSEGTLGVVTEVTVRLRTPQPPSITTVGLFSSVAEAGDAVRAVRSAGLTPAAFELIDRHCLTAVDRHFNMGLSLDADVVLLGRTDVVGPAGELEADLLLRSFEAAGATWAARSSTEDEAEALFAARRQVWPAVEKQGTVMTEDVCVPIAALPEMLARVKKAGEQHDTLIANIAHVGDGNLHPLLITPPGDEAAQARAEQAFDDIIGAAIELGGTVTGEHGIGLLKRRGFHTEVSPAILDMHRAIKSALDPVCILNPGKAF